MKLPRVSTPWILLVPCCALAASGTPSDFMIQLEVNNPGGIHISFPVQCTRGCDWDTTIIDCAAGEAICRGTVEGRRAMPSLQTRPNEIRAISGTVCIGIGITSVEAARMHGLPVDESAGDQQGAVVAGVGDGTPADLADFEVGDLLNSFNSVPILRGEDFVNALQGMAAGQSFEATLLRNGSILHVKGELGMQTTAHTCRAVDSRVIQAAIAPEELPPFELVIAVTEWRITASCLEGCMWQESGYSAGGDDDGSGWALIIDQQGLHREYAGQ